MRLRITLSDVNEVVAGSELSGYVMIYEGSPLRVRKASLSVSIFGRSKARIVTSRGTLITDNRIFHSQESEIRDKNRYIDSEEQRAPFWIPFSVCLDPNLPASFDSSSGSVKYWLEAKLKPQVSLRKTAKSPHVPIFVSPKAPSRDKVPTPRPYTLVKQKRLNSGWKEGGTLTLLSSLPDGPRYEPSSTIRLSLSMKNESRSSVTGVRAVLLQSTSYRAKGTALEQQRRLDAVECRTSVARGSSLSFPQLGLLSVPTSVLRSMESPCCSVRHAVEIHALRGGCKASVSQLIPIEIV